MVLKFLVHIQILAIFLVDGVFLEVKPQIRQQNNMNRVCYNVTIEPSFLKMAVVGRSWHTYYTWNQQFREMCLKTMFKVPTNMNQIVRFLKQKYYGLYEEPRWSKAELLMRMGDCKQIMLFRDRSGVHGQFDGLPYYKRNDFPHEIPLRTPYKINMKVIARGKYLLISDCTTGITFLLLRPEKRPTRVEIEAFASNFNFGDMYPACTQEPDPVIKHVTEEIVTEVITTSTKKYSKYDW